MEEYRRKGINRCFEYIRQKKGIRAKLGIEIIVSEEEKEKVWGYIGKGRIIDWKYLHFYYDDRHYDIVVKFGFIEDHTETISDHRAPEL